LHVPDREQVPSFARSWSGPVRGHAEVAVMSLLINVLITFLVIVLVLYLINMLPLDGRARQIVRVIVIVIGVLYLLRYIAPI
jgi:hypothetical protein